MIRVALGLFICFIASCATYTSVSRDALRDFYGGNFAGSAQQLEKKSNEDSKDQLLYLFDRGMALQLAGDYKESAKDWIRADQMSEVKDYTSLSTEAASILTSENVTQYKGEDFEKILINAFNAINYALVGDYENALVECRRVNNKLTRYRLEAKRDYEQNPFARYLSATIWEAKGDLEDAYIDYKATQQLVPDYEYLKYDLVRLAKRLGRTEDLKEWHDKYGDLETISPKEDRSTGEVILIYQQGRSAEKHPRPENRRFPYFVARPTRTQQAQLESVTQNAKEFSKPIYSVSDIAIKTLNDDYGRLVAKRVAGVVTKAVVADQIRQKNRLLGDLAWIGLTLSDQADVRFWSTLPQTLQFARLRLKPGTHTIKIVGLNGSGQPSGEEKTASVNVVAGQKTFLNWRSLN